ncbi:beta-ketoacyl-[acyl-carrier-protein] synthase family protein [Alicyclobacillus mengziensis]|uniref:Beta-ketoacyl-[acyl-carrier-protein] synthase family protein n=1 Tax=Alicyclobacillus mengziensis TaxID=2931921 RepID=A0A9X7Z756_9BACL|nr:beta-ketoacyl-[acyl-carrier-protein] synthase family protein [Alicyclobacillus mengziensis]QSO46878.1 beta-ketoacyl-[acyl-carrier-protein] synthase family protein [Alicyclobacillus mengziensis]
MASRVRIVVTGMGSVTPFGVGVSTFWGGLVKGESAVRAMSDVALSEWVPVAAEARDFEANDHLSRKLVMDTDRFTQMALVAAREAIIDAGFDGEAEYPFGDGDLTGRVGIAMGSAFGGVQSLEAGAVKLTTSTRVSPRLVSKSIPNAAAGAIAMRYHVQGPSMTYSTACASSANAIGEAAYWLRNGEVDMVLAGGAECLFTRVILAGLKSSGALALSGPDDMSQWSRPFDIDRQGMVMGEGAAILVLEELEHAMARGARIYAELTGYGSSNDAYHETAPHPDGEGAAAAMVRALKSAGLTPSDIDYINAHATSTPAGDAAECRALERVFTTHLASIPVSSIKGATGHLLGTAGAIESVACIKAIETDLLPPTANCDNPDKLAPPYLIRNLAQAQRVNRVLSNSFGFGGQNGVLIWERFS